MNRAQTVAKFDEYAHQCLLAYDNGGGDDALKRALSDCFHDFKALKPSLQIGSLEKAIFSIDSNPNRNSLLKTIRKQRSDIPVDRFIMKHSMPEMITVRTQEDNARTATLLQDGKLALRDTKAFYITLKTLASKLVSGEIINVRLAKLIQNFNCATRINESEQGVREHVPTRHDFTVNNHVCTFTGGSKVKGEETTRDTYQKLCLFDDHLTNGLLDIVFGARLLDHSIDKMHKAEFELLMQQYGIIQHVEPVTAKSFLPSHFRSLGARFIELLFDNDVAVNPAGSILHVTRRCLGHKSCEATQRYISIKCNGDMPEKIGLVSHVERDDLVDGGFDVKVYTNNKRRRRGKRGGRKINKRQRV